MDPCSLPQIMMTSLLYLRGNYERICCVILDRASTRLRCSICCLGQLRLQLHPFQARVSCIHRGLGRQVCFRCCEIVFRFSISFLDFASIFVFVQLFSRVGDYASYDIDFEYSIIIFIQYSVFLGIWFCRSEQVVVCV